MRGASAVFGRLGDGSADRRFSENVPNALMIARRRSVVMLLCIRELVRRYACDRAVPAMSDVGAGVIHSVVENVTAVEEGGGTLLRVLAARFFYPIDWRSRAWRAMPRPERQAWRPEWLDAAELLHAGLITNESYTTTFWSHAW